MTKSVPRGRKATGKSAAAKKTAGGGSRRSSAKMPTKEKQIALYDKAMKLFHAGNFAKAKVALDAVMKGPGPEIAHAARMHRAVCERRLSAARIKLESAEDYYNLGISLLNSGQLRKAEQHFLRALDKTPHGDHIHYALALCYGLQGDTEKAADRINSAVRLNPKNRMAIRNDPDFASFLGTPAVAAALRAEKFE